MRDANKLILPLIAAAALGACNKPQQNAVATDNAAAPSEVETLPADESSETSSNELVNGTDNADVNDIGNAGNNN